MSSFSFILTEVCNWECPYCYFTTIKQKEPKLETFQKHMPYIKETIDKLDDSVVNIDIQGGEIGTMPIEILEYFFQTIQKKIAISTNGLFLNKKMHLNKKIKPYIGLIMFHINDLSSINCNIQNYFIGNDVRISRGIVHDNIDEIVQFVKTHHKIEFDYIEFEFEIKAPRKMNALMYHELIDKIKDFDNVTDNAKSILYSRLLEKEDHRDNCRKYNHSILIDMVNENICLCQRQLDVSIPLNKENLIYRLKNFPKDVFKKDSFIYTSCDSCTRLYAGKFQGNVIERSLITRSKL